jgi:hypothetical protein
MPAKQATTINKIKTVQNPTNAEIIAQFYYYMKGIVVPKNHQNNCLECIRKDKPSCHFRNKKIMAISVLTFVFLH